MALFPLGILSAAGAGGAVAGSDYELIETQILGSSQASITFSSLGTYSSTYKHLQVRFTARTDRPTYATDGISLKYNGTNFTSYHYLYGNGTNVTSTYGTDPVISSCSASQSPANAFGAGIIDFLDIYASKNKTARSLTGQADPAAGGFTGSRVFVHSHLWASTTALTDFTFSSVTGSSFLTGSRFSLYGLKG